MDIIIGNVLSIFGMLADTFSSSRKTTKGILISQCAGQFFFGSSSFFLKGYSASVQNAVSILRNLWALSGKPSKIVEWFLIALGLALGFIFNNRGIYGLLPIVANLEYSIAIFRFKDKEVMLKAAFFLCVLLYTLFNVVIKNYVGIACNSIILVSTGLFIIRSLKNSNNDSVGNN